MAEKQNKPPRLENPGEERQDEDRTTPSGAGPQDPDGGGGGLAEMSQEADQQAVMAEAGVTDDMLALRDAVEGTLAASAKVETEAEAAPFEEGSSGQGIVGVGIGLPELDAAAAGLGAPGEPVLTLFTRSALAPEALSEALAEVAGTRSLSEMPVQQVVTGVVDAYSHRAMHRPAPAGVSMGHVDITAGTYGSRAIGLTAPWNNRHLVLSNNHVLANSNGGRVGDSIVQRGRADGGSHPAEQVAVLARWVPIQFGGAPNYVDAAFGWAWHQRIRGEQYYLSGGRPAYYKTGTAPLAATLGMTVGKSGRTTGLTMGRVTQIGVSVNVNFGGGRVALFRNQIAVRSVNSNPFSAGGDSGSLIWHWASGVRPVGLLFAGGGGTTFANPIASVLGALNIRLLP